MSFRPDCVGDSPVALKEVCRVGKTEVVGLPWHQQNGYVRGIDLLPLGELGANGDIARRAVVDDAAPALNSKTFKRVGADVLRLFGTDHGNRNHGLPLLLFLLGGAPGRQPPASLDRDDQGQHESARSP